MNFNKTNLLGLIPVVLTAALMVFTAGCSDDDDDPTGPEFDPNYHYVLDDSINAGDTVTWEAGVAYLCSGFVYVESSAVLNIDPGAVIKFATGSGAEASALIIARGGKIYAEGTANNPIIMTAKADSVGDPTDLPTNANGLWGGLIVLGYAETNTASNENIEGIPDEPRTIYGGTNNADNSGIIRYVSIRHGGSNIGAANEINGLTLGAVGYGTTIEYVEVFANQDDGIEFFGGTVNTKYIAVAMCGDDGFDYDEGFRGNGQYWFVLQASDDGGHAGEHDGGTTPETGQPYAIPVISNATYVGSGATSTNGGELCIKMRDNAGGKYHNSIFYDFYGRGLNIEDLDTESSRDRLDAGDIEFTHNLWYSFSVGNIADSIWAEFEEVINGPDTTEEYRSYTYDYMSDPDNYNEIVDPDFNGIARTPTGGLDPRPGASEATTNLVQMSDSFFDAVTFKGAFDPNTAPWVSGWTALEEYGFMQ